MNRAKSSFVGRSDELANLKLILEKKTSSLISITGRRRVGKSRLVEKFAENQRFLHFAGLPPDTNLTSQDQRDEFSRLLSEQVNVPEFSTDDWAKLFALLGREVQTGRVIILFDEISWMAHDDATFLSKLKNAWEMYYKSNNELILILCSSVSMWMEENILSSTGYFGRISWNLHIDPLPIADCNAMLEAQGFKSSAYEKFKILSITGGIPWYIEQMHGQLSAEANIKRQCFTKGGILVNDFDRIFHELFEKRDDVYKKIIISLVDGPMTYDDISKQTAYPKSGRLTQYLNDLVKAGFVRKDQNWSLQSGAELDLYKYRLSDNYIRFYLKYISPKKNQIDNNRLKDVNLFSLAAWDTIMGLQFENLVVNNRHELYPLLRLNPADIVYDNPFFQRKTKRQKGCQVDLLIHTKFKTLYVIEVKFSRDVILKDVIDSVEEKIKRISLPRGFAVLPVLVHVNGVSKQVADAGFFHTIIDFSELLQ